MKRLNLIKNDPWLEPYESEIESRYLYSVALEKELTRKGKIKLSDFATGYLYFGLHRSEQGWVCREWAPNATDIFIIGDFNSWQEREEYRMERLDNGVWQIELPSDMIAHLSQYKLKVHWQGGCGERIPAWCRRVVQDEQTQIFSAQVWAPEQPYQFKVDNFVAQQSPLLIYECHIGMATEQYKVGSYDEFRRMVLPKIKELGYNCIQIMAIQEHPYYGSFGYHVSSFFAASSRFGTPDELKALIDEAHTMGIAVIMDIVHSHAVKNEVEGLGRFDGSESQYFYGDGRREHPAWDSLCFDYGKHEVIHFLLSNCKFWLEEYKFDGYRFDGVTSMLYYNHGLGQAFGGYDDYYNGGQDLNAIAYLTLANKLIHQVNAHAITIAEEMSGMPGLASEIKDGGIGFDYRMAMGIPDYWIKMIKEKSDVDWHPSSIWWEVTNRRQDERTVSYAESHDQALVGDKTIIFRLIDADMYWHMAKHDSTLIVDRGMALHKMIRLVTASTINGAYLNFMGNEFGHPEWIDFPRQGNDWSYHYARRQWSLVDRKDLRYHQLADFDKQMLTIIQSQNKYISLPLQKVWDSDGDQILAYMRGNLLFVFNFSPTNSYTDYGFLVPKGQYRVVLDSDHTDYGGFGLVDDSIIHASIPDPLYVQQKKEWVKLYVPSRTAMVLQKL